MKRLHFAPRLLLLLALFVNFPASAEDDRDVLTAMLQHFLANADQRDVHEAFWSDDLVYSSSSGLRFGKAEIMRGFEGAAEAGGETPAVSYAGEEIDIRLYGDVAVVAFKLVGTPADGSARLYYYNTGTFLKRNGAWRAVAWQATTIPPPADG